jgi:flagellin-like protein
MVPTPTDDRATSPVVGVAVLFVVAVVVAGAVGVGVFLGDETVTASVRVDTDDNGGATVTWSEAGNADYIEVRTENGLGNATIEAVNDRVELPEDVGEPGETTVVVRAVNNDSERVIEEQEVELE